MVADVDEARVAAVKQRRRSGERMDVIPPKALTSDFSDRQISACFRREEVGWIAVDDVAGAAGLFRGMSAAGGASWGRLRSDSRSHTARLDHRDLVGPNCVGADCSADAEMRLARRV